MAIIYTYPVKTTPVDADLILMSDSADANKTKQVTVGSLPFSNNAGTVTSVGIAVPAAFEASAAITTSGTITIGVTGGNAGQYLAHDGTWGTPAGGAANPAGAVTQIQYHDTGGVFGASTNLSFSTSRLTVANMIDIKGDGSSNAGKLKLYCQDNSTPHYVELIGPAHSGSPVSYSLTLPNALPNVANQILESNASGALSWIATPTGGSSYQAGNGIDIDTSTNPDTISAGLLTNGGLVFNGNKLQVDLAATAMSGKLRVVDGGTNIGTYAQGDLLYAETASTLATINTSSGNKYLGTATASPYNPEWKTSLVPEEINTGNLLIGGATSTSEMTLLDPTAKGTIVVGSGSTTTTKAVGTDTHVLTAKSADATGVSWEAITFPTVDLTSGVTGTLPIGNGGTGSATFFSNGIVRGNGTNALAADTNFTYNGLTGALTLAGQLVATANAGTNTAVRGIASNSTSTQGWATNLGVANFDQNDTGAYCTTIAVNTESTNGKLISFYYQENSGTGPKGEIKYDTTSSQVQYNVTSDYRLKENIVDLTSAVDRVKNLKPKRFNFIGNASEIDGFLAHEVQEVVPQAVSGTKDQIFEDGQVNPQQMDASKLVPVLTAAIKELTARIEALEA